MTVDPDNSTDARLPVGTPDHDASPASYDLRELTDPTRRVAWITRVIGQGLTRVYAATIDPSSPGLSGELAFAGIDRILKQINSICREGSVAHVRCARWGNDLAILVDADARFDWVLPSVESRLEEELTNRDLELDEAQRIDLARGEKLRLWSTEFQLVSDGAGGCSVKCKALKKSDVAAPIEVPNEVPAAPRRKPFAPLAGFIGALHFLKTPICVVGRALGAFTAPFSLLRQGVRPRRLIWRDWIGLGCGLAALVLTVLLVREIYAAFPHENAMATQPPGFYDCYFPWGVSDDPSYYGLYIPPNLKDDPGPHPLLMFLHSGTIGNKDMWLTEGLPDVLQSNARKGKHFDFVVFCPHAAGSGWRSGSAGNANAMLMLDYVVGRHNIDSKRIYLTGTSLGGEGVWNFAQDYPDKWAAIVPLASAGMPNVEKIKGIPMWIFHGENDPHWPAAEMQRLVKRLEDAKAEVHYTEVPDAQHSVWHRVYRNDELYDWLLTKSK